MSPSIISERQDDIGKHIRAAAQNSLHTTCDPFHSELWGGTGELERNASVRVQSCRCESVEIVTYNPRPRSARVLGFPHYLRLAIVFGLYHSLISKHFPLSDPFLSLHGKEWMSVLNRNTSRPNSGASPSARPASAVNHSIDPTAAAGAQRQARGDAPCMALCPYRSGAWRPQTSGLTAQLLPSCTWHPRISGLTTPMHTPCIHMVP